MLRSKYWRENRAFGSLLPVGDRSVGNERAGCNSRILAMRILIRLLIECSQELTILSLVGPEIGTGESLSLFESWRRFRQSNPTEPCI